MYDVIPSTTQRDLVPDLSMCQSPSVNKAPGVELNVEQATACVSIKPKRRGLPYFHLDSQNEKDREQEDKIGTSLILRNCRGVEGKNGWR